MTDLRAKKAGVVDLTHTLAPSMPSWDGSCGFNLNIETDYKDCTGPDLFRTQTIATRAGMGTHIDAPAHCFEGGKTVEGLSLRDLIADCAVIRLDNGSERSVLTPEMVEKYEREHGRIQPGTFVLFDSGWARFWSEPEKYRNNLLFPSVHEDTAKLLIDREISGLGTDTLSADCGGKLFPVHRKILGAGRYLVENIANADLLPAVGSKVIVMPMKVLHGTEAPIRLIAFPRGMTIHSGG